MGVDYRGLAKTTLSYDELLTYSSIDNAVTDNHLTYQLSNGVPVDLGPGMEHARQRSLRRSDHQCRHYAGNSDRKLQWLFVV